MANSQLTYDQSLVLAEKISREAGSDNGRFIDLAFETILSRRANPAELKSCQEFLKRGAGRDIENPLQRVRENLVVVLFNHNEFVTIR